MRALRVTSVANMAALGSCVGGWFGEWRFEAIKPAAGSIRILQHKEMLVDERDLEIEALRVVVKALAPKSQRVQQPPMLDSNGMPVHIAMRLPPALAEIRDEQVYKRVIGIINEHNIDLR